jgi:lipopolysaccharide/colanic/teichoic acid biosynthesis glycosyltransferase
MYKRFFDLVIVISTAFLWLPLIAALAGCSAIFLGRPVFFTQMRPGKGGKPFKILKLRTMTEGVDAQGALLSDAERLTTFGKFLRSTSLDEFPEIVNVLKGDMSLVGPRPLLMEYIDRYTPEQARRHEICPGITGWAQVNGRNTICWEDKFTLDVWYVDHRSMLLDIKILWMTITKVFKRDGISEDGHATANKFMGSCHNDKE